MLDNGVVYELPYAVSMLLPTIYQSLLLLPRLFTDHQGPLPLDKYASRCTLPSEVFDF